MLLKNKNLILILLLLIFGQSMLTAQSLTDDLILYYPLDQTVNDLGPNMLNGDLIDGVYCEDRFGNQNEAVCFEPRMRPQGMARQ